MTDTDKIQIIRSDRKTISLQLKHNGDIVVRAPLKMTDREIKAFLKSKEGWLTKHLEQIEKSKAEMPCSDKLSYEEIKALADKACSYLPGRVAFFAEKLGVTYGKITVRNQRSRWGSCSSKGNLNFNCLLMLCPFEVIDYVVIHELCHRIHLNHSKDFWATVESIMPDYKTHEKWLKDNGSALIDRMLH